MFLNIVFFLFDQDGPPTNTNLWVKRPSAALSNAAGVTSYRENNGMVSPKCHISTAAYDKPLAAVEM
jgi:hypothetical protein